MGNRRQVAVNEGGNNKGQKPGIGNGGSETLYRSKVSGQEIGDRTQERG